jgi:hypothetical protein
MRKRVKVEENIYHPPTKGFVIYKYVDCYKASRRIGAWNTISRTFFSLEDCYAFLEKHKYEIIPDELEVSVHLQPCREGEV